MLQGRPGEGALRAFALGAARGQAIGMFQVFEKE
jgi:hypothetical protein